MTEKKHKAKPAKGQKSTPPKNKPKDNGKHPGGRPPKYTQEYLSDLAKKMLVWFKKKNNWWLKDFAIKYGFTWQRISEFADQSKEFSDALDLCKLMQESKLVHKSFLPYQDRPAYNALKNTCGWRDHTDITSDGEKISSVEVTIKHGQ